MGRQAYVVVALGVIAAGLLAIEPLQRWAEITGQVGLEWSFAMPAFGGPLLCLVATLIAAWSYGLRSAAAGAVIAVGLLATWGSAWLLVSPFGTGWFTLAGGLMATAAGIGLIYVRTSAPPEALVPSSETA